MELFVNIRNGLPFSQWKLYHRCSTELYIGLQKYWNFQNAAKVEQIVSIVTKRSVSCSVLRTVLYPPAELHYGPSQESEMNLFVRIVNSFKSTLLIVFTKSSIVNVRTGCHYTSDLLWCRKFIEYFTFPEQINLSKQIC